VSVRVFAFALAAFTLSFALGWAVAFASYRPSYAEGAIAIYRTCVAHIPAKTSDSDRPFFETDCAKSVGRLRGLTPRQIELATGYLFIPTSNGSTHLRLRTTPPPDWWESGCK